MQGCRSRGVAFQRCRAPQGLCARETFCFYASAVLIFPRPAYAYTQHCRVSHPAGSHLPCPTLRTALHAGFKSRRKQNPAVEKTGRWAFGGLDSIQPAKQGGQWLALQGGVNTCTRESEEIARPSRSFFPSALGAGAGTGTGVGVGAGARVGAGVRAGAARGAAYAARGGGRISSNSVSSRPK